MTRPKDSYRLLFTMALRSQPKLVVGRLLLQKDSEIINAFQATSSLPGFQYRGSWNKRGGVIPPGAYAVNLNPINLKQVRGIDGNFYPITPFEVETDGDDRSDFGIHFDANVPGSLGCIVLCTVLGWRAFERVAFEMTMLGISQLPISVVYPESL